MLENMVARDGIEPPTPAFSGWHSAALIFLIPFVLVAMLLSIPPVILE